MYGRGTNSATGNNNKQNSNVMIKKSIYEAPETELILVRFEESFLTGTVYGSDNQPGKGWGTGDNDEDIIEGGSF